MVVINCTRTHRRMANVSPVDRVRGALWGLLIADALSMPVHWYYDVNSLVRDFKQIDDYQAPKAKHPSSIMNLSNTGGHGRGGQSGNIIGDVINHGKKQFWGVPGMHYHQGMKKGENTLNALCARVIMRSITKAGGYSAPAALSDYVSFMTTPGSHNDTYAESFHRDFFRNFAAGVPPEKCAHGTEGHNTAQIGGFVMLPPVILGALSYDSPAAAKTAALQQLRLTHESKKLEAYAELYIDLLTNVAQGKPLRESLKVAAQRLQLNLDDLMSQRWDDVRVVHSVFGSACYIQDSFPSVLYLAYKYADSFEDAVLANTNVGGENCHRGAALGAVMGAAVGEAGIPRRFIEGLHDYANIKKEMDAYIKVVFPHIEHEDQQHAQPVTAAAGTTSEL